MTLPEKYGLFFMLLGSSSIFENGWRGSIGLLLMIGGWIAFVSQQKQHQTKREMNLGDCPYYHQPYNKDANFCPWCGRDLRETRQVHSP